MAESRDTAPEPRDTSPASTPPAASRSAAARRRESLRWWLKLAVQPALFLLAGVLLLTGLGAAQKLGLISAAGQGEAGEASGTEASSTRWICPMMCTPPQAEPGRCPVCKMQLVPAPSSTGDSPERSIAIDPVARRIADIQTAEAQSLRLTRQIRAIGELQYDESSLKTLSAYVAGRLDRLYADFTGAVVQEGDDLALLYSPKLYSGQVELLLAKKARDQAAGGTLDRVQQAQTDLYASARQRLIEWGMTAAQIEQLEQTGEPTSRLRLNAPISGTVIEKLAVQGQYVEEGQPIYRLADLSTVWLMLELFPENAAAIRYGQTVAAEVQSLPGRPFGGRVAFIDPQVDPRTRTVGVRVVVPNDQGLLRVGDYAKATIEVPVSPSGDPAGKVYDPELADKWISPRHPHVIESEPGMCRVCGVELVPASRFGFTDDPDALKESLVVPRSAVLAAGDRSVVYVEDPPGHFEMRRVTLGPFCGDQVAIVDGVEEGEQVAVEGAFLIDSQMQLAGNPSLIDPAEAEPAEAGGEEDPDKAGIAAALAKLSPEDRALAERQKICPVAKMPLGSMGVPIKVDVGGRPVFICCEGCREGLLAEPEKYLEDLPEEPSP